MTAICANNKPAIHFIRSTFRCSKSALVAKSLTAMVSFNASVSASAFACASETPASLKCCTNLRVSKVLLVMVLSSSVLVVDASLPTQACDGTNLDLPNGVYP